ncbi:MAG: TonB-dependent receptor [Bacteroidales bacterium]|nr:TonB-dependent receptor [Bacteroidales bacterium]MDZ4205297.1 TonB-dependent receptor [Bacteroidales bacterium]
MTLKVTLGILLLLFHGFVLKGQALPDTTIVLKGIEVTDKAPPPLYPTTVMEAKILETRHIADIGELLRTVPNISGIRRGGYAVDPVVRGFRFSQVNIFLDDGVHIEGGCPNRMDPVLAHIEPEDIRRLEIVRGPYMLKYGNAIGSTIRVITCDNRPFDHKKLQATSFSGFDFNRKGFRQHHAVTGSTGNFYYRLSGGYKHFGDYTDGNGKVWNADFTKYSLSADLGIRLSQRQDLEIFYKGSFGRDVMFPALPMDEVADNTNIIQARYTLRNRSNKQEVMRISAYHSMVYHEMDNSLRPQYSVVVSPYQGLMQAVAKADTRSTGARLIMQHRNNGYLLEGGCDIDKKWKDGNRHVKMIMTMNGQEFVSVKNFNLWKEASMVNSGVFAGISTHSRPLVFSATLRADVNHSASSDTLMIVKDDQTYFDSKSQALFFWSLAMNAAWQANDHIKLSLSLGRSVRPPDLQERYIKFLATGFDRYDYLGNPNLKPEINYQADLVFEYTTPDFQFSTNIFRSDIQNFIFGTLLPPAVARPQSMGAPGVKQFNNLNRAVFYGFESVVKAEPMAGLHISLATGYTYAYFPKIEKIVLENEQATGTQLLNNDPLPEMPAFESLFMISYQLLEGRLQPSFELRVVATQAQVSEASYEEKTPGFVLPGLNLAWQTTKSIRLMAGVANIFNKAYYEHLNRRMIGTSGKLYEPGRTFFINLKMKL